MACNTSDSSEKMSSFTDIITNSLHIPFVPNAFDNNHLKVRFFKKKSTERIRVRSYKYMPISVILGIVISYHINCLYISEYNLPFILIIQNHHFDTRERARLCGRKK